MDRKESTFSTGNDKRNVQAVTLEHVLSRGRKQTQPQRVIFFDTETTWREGKDGTQSHYLRMGWACYINYQKRGVVKKERRWFYFEKQHDYHKWVYSLLRDNRTVYAIGSNVWFDIRITNIDYFLFSKGYICDRLYDEGLCTILRYSKGSSHIIFLAIQNFLRYSVDGLGELLGLPKLHVDFLKSNKADMKRYCKRDVEILVEAFTWYLDFITKRESGSFGITISQQAFNLYRSSFMPTKIVIHTNETVIRLERDGYFGGRTEPFFIGKVPEQVIHKIDINALYGSVMIKHCFPRELLSYHERLSVSRCRQLIQRHGIIARVRVNITEPFLPIVIAKKTCFPIGEFDTVVCTEALQRLLAKNQVVQILEAALYDMAVLFAGYVEHYNELKERFTKSDEKLGRATCKLLINSLYGKFGQFQEDLLDVEPTEPTMIENMPIYDVDGTSVGKIVTYGGLRRYYGSQIHNARNSLVAVAAHVTEYARFSLWNFICKAGRDNVYYCDTDSLFVNEQGYKRLSRYIDAARLGYFKYEGAVKECIIYGAKDYVIDGQHVCKGIRAEAEEVAAGVYEQYKFSSFRTFLSSDIHDTYKVVKIRKKLKRQYSKGILHNNGRVSPFRLPM